MRISESNITRLSGSEIFVFGSNLAGRHGAGAALQAKRFGATYGRCHGLDGRVYGIPTKDENLNVLPLERIQKYVRNFITDATAMDDKTFLVTPIGCGLAGYTASEIAPLFNDAVNIKNIHLPIEFWEELKDE